jgi:coenzyme F420-reducing hydrogenase gamma subunit
MRVSTMPIAISPSSTRNTRNDCMVSLLSAGAVCAGTAAAAAAPPSQELELTEEEHTV